MAVADKKRITQKKNIDLRKLRQNRQLLGSNPSPQICKALEHVTASMIHIGGVWMASGLLLSRVSL